MKISGKIPDNQMHFFDQIESLSEKLAKTYPLTQPLVIENDNGLSGLALFMAWIRCGGVAGFVSPAARKALALATLPKLDECPNTLYTLPDCTVEGPGLISFTSGSTGVPKGIFRSMESWHTSFRRHRHRVQTRSDAPALVLGDLSHSLHLFGAVEAIDRGIIPQLLKAFAPATAVELCQQNKSQIIYATPSHLNLILSYARHKNIAPLTSLRYILCGGAKLDEQRRDDLARYVPNARILEFFGTTETSYMTMSASDTPHGSVGKALEGVELVVGTDPASPAPAGTNGPIWVRSDMLFTDYISGKDTKTRWKNGFLCVGDHGHLDDEGNLFFEGRAGNMVVIAGENIFLDQIEAVLRKAIPEGEVVVLPVEDAMRGTRLIAATNVTLAQSRSDAVLRDLRAEFGALKAPKKLLQIESWPFLPSGKSDRTGLAQMIGELS